MTKKQISDMVLYKLAGGVPDSSFPIDERDVWDSLEHKVNTMIKSDQFAINLPSGGTIPENLVLATYEDIAVTRTSNERSKCTLPVTPISLPRNAGVNEIRPQLNVVSSGDKMLGNPIIPLQAGQDFLLQADSLLNNLQGQWGYTISGKTITFTKDLTVFDITKVDMKLVVMDVSQYTVNDDLPIPADWVGRIEDELIQEFAPIVAESGFVNNYTNAGQTQPENAKK
jgi:hypothetical protein